ncbi:hypothetical protein HK101_011143 [Irineochytrium annulatum]|nr:hypothetical protein HK101_011143 [Irineochytrium annulatum]
MPDPNGTSAVVSGLITGIGPMKTAATTFSFGQTKEVAVHKIAIVNTIEKRIVQLFETKQTAVGEGGVKVLKAAGLSPED